MNPAADHAFTMASTNETARILVVDDEDTIRLVLAKYLRTRGFEVATAESGDAALEALAGSRFDLMLCDVRMPGLSGIEIVPAALETTPDLGIVMLSAVNDAPTATEALASGVLDYLIKPVELQKLHEAVVRAIEKRASRNDQRLLGRAVREEAAARTRQLELEKMELREVTLNLLDRLVTISEARDPYQSGHSTRVALLATAIAESMALPPDVVEDLRVAARLHDIGNLGIRADILARTGKLDAPDLAHVREHVRIALEVLRPLTFAERIITFIGDHHERWDGSGYPSGTAGERISVGGRVLAVAEAFDAVTSRRPHRAALSRDAAIDHLRRDVGAAFDPRVFEALRAVVKSGKVALA